MKRNKTDQNAFFFAHHLMNEHLKLANVIKYFLPIFFGIPIKGKIAPEESNIIGYEFDLL